MSLVDNQDGANAILAQIAREKKIRLYDPPKDGKTPVDGAGEPQFSVVRVGDKDAKLALGFTDQPVGFEAAAAEPDSKPVSEEKPVKTANMPGKAARKGTTKR